MKKEKSIELVEATLDFFEALLAEDYSYCGNDSLTAEEQVNLHAARSETIKAISETDTLDAALEIIRAETIKQRESAAENVKSGGITKEDLENAGITPL